MTEPTHHVRRDVAAELDILLSGVLMAQGFDDLDKARSLLRHYLARAWQAGERSGYRSVLHDRTPDQNPYDETDIA